MFSISSAGTLVIATLLLTQVNGGPHEVQLIDDLMANYSSYARPSPVDNEPLKVEFQVTLRNIIDVDESKQTISTNLWLHYKWRDYKLSWIPSDYGNITSIRLPANKLWKPDIFLYNSADTASQDMYPVKMVVYSDGTVNQVPPGIFTTSCHMNTRWFPFDDQLCELMFGSWTYDGTQINLQTSGGAQKGSLDGYSASSEWDLLGFPLVRNVITYDCCPDSPYIDLTYTIKLRRRQLYYAVNIIAPSLILAALTLAMFIVPPSSGEKLTLGVMVLLSLIVLMLMVTQALPPSSDAVPLITMFFGMIVILNAISLIFTAFVLNYHHRTSETHSMPRWVKRGVCERLAWLLRMERPGHDFSASKNADTESDIKKPLPSDADSTHAALQTISRELRLISDRTVARAEADQVTRDWQFAAAVIDRLLLWLFTITTVICCLAILLSAPDQSE